MHVKKSLLVVFLAAALPASFFTYPLAAGFQATSDIPDFTDGDSIPEKSPHDWNLGPTGARGWMYSNKLETSEARQIMVTSVEAGSPADGILQPGDVILGAASRLFKFDPRTELGRAISNAEASSGKLLLVRWRDGRRKGVTVQLPVLGLSAQASKEALVQQQPIPDHHGDAEGLEHPGQVLGTQPPPCPP